MAQKIYGLIGYPVKHSLSPVMHNAAFKAAGIDAEYRLFEVSPDRLEDFLLGADSFEDDKGEVISAGHVAGFNITVPHKVKAREIFEREGKLDPSFGVKITGAINTVRREPSKCFNTDVPGFTRSLKEAGFEIKEKNVLLLGCGGAGRSVVAGLAREANHIYIYEQNKEAAEVASRYLSPSMENFSFIGQEELSGEINNCQLLVNATPLGMHDNDPSPIDKNLLHKDLFVYDVVYNRNKDTQLIKDVKDRADIQHATGLGMLLYQGVLAWEHWTQREAPVGVMREALLNAVSK